MIRIMTSPSELTGSWQMIRAELDGESAPEMVTSRMILELGDRSYAVVYAGEVSDTGSWENGVNAGTLILLGHRGPNAGRRIPCLYQLAGDRLRVCYGLDGTEPAGFSTAGLKQRYAATYRRL
ncbi:MAG: hypothetical protein RLZZ221_1527 [Verrucomicrobiota bacterium]